MKEIHYKNIVKMDKYWIFYRDPEAGQKHVDLDACANGKIAVMFTVAYLYEHREEADHHAMDLTLRALLFGSRKEGF